MNDVVDLTLVRHTAVDVPRGVCYGATDVPLASTFEAEAAVVAARLRDLPPFDRVFTSPLSRCRRLASYCGYPDAEVDARLAEMDFGEWEMKRYDEISDPRLQLWFDDWLHAAPTGGESFMDQQRRFSSFLHEHASGSRLLVFTHGGILTQARILCGMPPDEAFRTQPPYGAVIQCALHDL